MSIAYRSWKGIGMDLNCTAAALHYEAICADLYLGKEGYKMQTVIQRKRLDMELYNVRQGIFDVFYSPDQVQILENVIEVQRNNYHDLINLAYYYYYGLGGLKQDYKKAYDIFNKFLLENKKNV